MLLKNKVEIEEWLNKYKIENYELIEDKEYGYVVNVNGFVDLFNKKLKSIDVKFNIVDGWFYCSCNKLISLEGCPEIVKGSFNCISNKLASLIGCPKIINGGFYCNHNNLSIEGIKTLLNVEINSNYIELHNNKKLGELQNIKDFNEVKRILQIYQEKKELNSLIKTNDDKIIKENIIKI